MFTTRNMIIALCCLALAGCVVGDEDSVVDPGDEAYSGECSIGQDWCDGPYLTYCHLGGEPHFVTIDCRERGWDTCIDWGFGDFDGNYHDCANEPQPGDGDDGDDSDDCGEYGCGY